MILMSLLPFSSFDVFYFQRKLPFLPIRPASFSRSCFELPPGRVSFLFRLPYFPTRLLSEDGGHR